MRIKFLLVLLVGLALAGFAVHMAQGRIGAYKAALQHEQNKAREAVPTTPVYVAAKALKYGDRITADDVREVAWPQNAIPEGTFTVKDGKLLGDGSPDQQRTVLRAMEKDEAIMAIKVTAPGEEAGLNARLDKGMRAFAIRVDVASGVSGFLRPGDRVDVYWTGNTPNGNGDITKLIQTAVKLIAIDQTANDDSLETAIARTVTVAVTPQQVAALAQAQATGALTLSLVGVGDDSVANAIEVDQRELLGIQKVEKVAEAPKEQVCTIRTRRGAEVVEIPIPCTN